MNNMFEREDDIQYDDDIHTVVRGCWNCGAIEQYSYIEEFNVFCCESCGEPMASRIFNLLDRSPIISFEEALDMINDYKLKEDQDNLDDCV